MRLRRSAAPAALAVLIATLAGCSSSSGGASVGPTTHLNGLFRLTAGHCASKAATPTGSYLIVISAASGHAVRNPESACANADYTPLAPGTDGGLITGKFQGQPSPTFNAQRDSRAHRITKLVRFRQFTLGLATSSRDEQDAPSGRPAFPAPAAIVQGNQLSVDLRSLVMTYAGRPDTTCAESLGLGCWNLGSISASGTYNAATRHFVVQWFTGESFVPQGDSLEVHLEGTFVPRST